MFSCLPFRFRRHGVEIEEILPRLQQVTAGEALKVAQQAAALLQPGQYFLDLNSVAPETNVGAGQKMFSCLPFRFRRHGVEIEEILPRLQQRGRWRAPR
jgi:hypothetical protein